jgi:hypothetical protein
MKYLQLSHNVMITQTDRRRNRRFRRRKKKKTGESISDLSDRIKRPDNRQHKNSIYATSSGLLRYFP